MSIGHVVYFLRNTIMKTQELTQLLRERNFSETENKGNWFKDGSLIYSKEVTNDIYLLYIIFEDNIQGLITKFHDCTFIGKREPAEVMFYMSVKDKQDVDYFDKFLEVLLVE